VNNNISLPPTNHEDIDIEKEGGRYADKSSEINLLGLQTAEE
jgi:hypothetical protein